jgi:hypothetical protein
VDDFDFIPTCGVGVVSGVDDCEMEDAVLLSAHGKFVADFEDGTVGTDFGLPSGVKVCCADG